MVLHCLGTDSDIIIWTSTHGGSCRFLAIIAIPRTSCSPFLSLWPQQYFRDTMRLATAMPRNREAAALQIKEVL